MVKIVIRSVQIMSILVLSFHGGFVFADSCPYCGQEYGEPMPGDESRVYALRRKHEASCLSRPVQSSNSGYRENVQTNYANDHSARGRQDEFLRQRSIIEKQEAERRMSERERIEKERKVRTEEQEKIEKEKFNKKKSELVSSLKGVSTKPKGLKIREVPAPIIKKSYVSDKEKEKKASGEKEKEAEGVVKKTFKESLKRTKEDIDGKAKSELFKETAGKVPGVSYVKSVYDKYKKMRDEMKELNMNIFQYSMKGIKDGIRRLASPNISDGGFSDEYESGREDLFGRTAVKTRELLKDELEGD